MVEVGRKFIFKQPGDMNKNNVYPKETAGGVTEIF